MTQLDIFFPLIPVLPLIFKSFSDVKHVKFICTPISYSNFLALSYLTLALYTGSLVFALTQPHNFENFFKISIIFASVIALIKRKYKLYNSIEEIYEAILQIGLVFYCIYPPSSLPVFSLVLFSSISAGISKIQSPLWSISGNGFLMFCTLPSISRKFVRLSASQLVKKSQTIKFLMSLVSLIIPYIQIVSALILLFLAKYSLLFSIALFLQISFAVLLFILADLSWIVQIYAALIIMYAYVNNMESVSLLPYNLSELICFIAFVYSICCIIEIFLPKLKESFKSNKLRDIWTNLFLKISPFKMFTEPHMLNIITHHFQVDSQSNSHKINAFDEYGVRSSTQNLSSRHLQALMYPLGDLCMSLYHQCNNLLSELQEIELNKVSKSDLHTSQLKAIFDHDLVSKVALYQHTFSIDECSFKTSHIANIHHHNSGMSCIIQIQKLLEIKPFTGR